MDKLICRPEGRENIYLVEKIDLKKWIKSKKFKTIHNFVQSSFMAIGADHNVKDVLLNIDKAEKIAILIGDQQAHNLGHALALILNNKLKMYDIGNIIMSDLEVRK